MPLVSALFTGNPVLDRVDAGSAVLFVGSPANERRAVQLVQTALVGEGFALPVSMRSGAPDGRFGAETRSAVIAFQRRVFPGDSRQWDGRFGARTLAELDRAVAARGAGPAPTPSPTPSPTEFVCGPDVSAQVAAVWSRIQSDFRARSRADKIRLCNKVLIPVNDPVGLIVDAVRSRSLDQLMAQLRAHADINGWDVIPLYQGESEWLRRPPVFDPALNGPFATPSSSDFGNSDPFADGHEDPATCSNTVQVNGKCWLNGSVNYGTYGIMVRECRDFAVRDLFVPNTLSLNPFDQPLALNPTILAIYSLQWATSLIRAYKRFGNNPEGAVVPVAWTEATFNGGPTASPTITENRPRCQCRPGLTGSIVTWHYVWEPLKPRATVSPP